MSASGDRWVSIKCCATRAPPPHNTPADKTPPHASRAPFTIFMIRIPSSARTNGHVDPALRPSHGMARALCCATGGAETQREGGGGAQRRKCMVANISLATRGLHGFLGVRLDADCRRSHTGVLYEWRSKMAQHAITAVHYEGDTIDLVAIHTVVDKELGSTGLALGTVQRKTMPGKSFATSNSCRTAKASPVSTWSTAPTMPCRRFPHGADDPCCRRPDEERAGGSRLKNPRLAPWEFSAGGQVCPFGQRSCPLP